MTTLAGKVRRFALTVLGGVAVAPSRRGACNHCGACCEGCPFHVDARCAIYELRPPQCRAFPLDSRDLDEVGRCSYRFAVDGCSHSFAGNPCELPAGHDGVHVVQFVRRPSP